MTARRLQVLMSGLRAAVDAGKACAVGVCNYDAAQLEQAKELLAKHDIPLASNQVRCGQPPDACAATAAHACGACLQVEYSLLKRSAETGGLLAACEAMGVAPIAHSPLCQGLLTEFALERVDRRAEEVKPLLQLLQFIGAVSGGKSVEQVRACMHESCMHRRACLRHDVGQSCSHLRCQRPQLRAPGAGVPAPHACLSINCVLCDSAPQLST
jgi:aryl-alcohol dehydrogenase-like predicted oxidoreductase